VNTIVASNPTQYSIWRANRNMKQSVNADIARMREKAGLPPMKAWKSPVKEVVVARNGTEYASYLMDWALTEGVEQAQRFAAQIGSIVDSQA